MQRLNEEYPVTTNLYLDALQVLNSPLSVTKTIASLLQHPCIIPGANHIVPSAMPIRHHSPPASRHLGVRPNCSCPKRRAHVTCHELKPGRHASSRSHRIQPHPSQFPLLSLAQQISGTDVIPRQLTSRIWCLSHKALRRTS
jgi:hypothetical protein